MEQFLLENGSVIGGGGLGSAVLFYLTMKVKGLDKRMDKKVSKETHDLQFENLKEKVGEIKDDTGKLFDQLDDLKDLIINLK